VKPVLDKLGSSRFSDLRANYLLVMWDQYPMGRKKALFTGLAADPCPLCGDPDSMDHVALRCPAPALEEKRQELWTDVNRPYLFGRVPAKTIPPGCTERVWTYLREYMKLAFSVDLTQNRYDGDEDNECLALWLARAQWPLLNCLDELFLHRLFTVPELLYLRKELISVQAKLLYGAYCLIRL
jgi:hypothetical protein